MRCCISFIANLLCPTFPPIFFRCQLRENCFSVVGGFRFWTCLCTGLGPARAGETRVAFPDPARTDDSTASASIAGAIAPATAPRKDQDRPGAQSPRPAPVPPTAGALHPPGRALAYVVLGETVSSDLVHNGRGNAVRFLFRPRAPAQKRGVTPWGSAPQAHSHRASNPAPGDPAPLLTV